jgi:regulator of sirC expression with transglutaminase-like and TPR domain
MNNAFLSESQKTSLFRLLQDEDRDTLSLVKQQLVSQGNQVLPQLEGWLKEVHGSPAEPHLRDVLGQLRSSQSDTEFLRFCQKASTLDEVDLEEASLLLSSTEYPAMSLSAARNFLDELTDDVKLELAKNERGPAIRSVSHVIHEKHQFRGNRDRYYDADNTYLNRVLERKLGIPISLSLLYLVLGRRLDLQINGVALPGHFIITWKGEFFDPFNRGRLLTKEDCREIVEARRQEFLPEFLSPASPQQVLSRMLRNLIRVYEIEEDRSRLARITRYLKALEGN